MEPPVDRVRISQAAKDQLIKLKRITKIDQWNILCRWALCRSLAEPPPPSPVAIPADSNVEMTWQVFGGAIGDLLILALKQRCHNEGLGKDQETLATQFRLHLHRGIGYLAGDQKIKSIKDLITLTESLDSTITSNNDRQHDRVASDNHKRNALSISSKRNENIYSYKSLSLKSEDNVVASFQGSSSNRLKLYDNISLSSEQHNLQESWQKQADFQEKKHMTLLDLYSRKVSENPEGRLRSKTQEILRAYRHSWDILSELIQNSVDAINRRYKVLNDPTYYLYEPFKAEYDIPPDPEYRGILRVKIDVPDLLIRIRDNGVGIAESDLALFLLPDESGKVLGKDYGFKGYGLTFAAFMSEEFNLKSKFLASEIGYEIGFNGLFEWLVDKQNIISFPQEPCPDVTACEQWFDENVSTEIILKLKDEYASKVAAVAAADFLFAYAKSEDYWEAFEYILRTKTAIGNTRSLFNEPPSVPIDIELSIKFADGSERTDHIPYEFYHPREHNEIRFMLYDFAEYVEKFSQASFDRNFRGLYYYQKNVTVGTTTPILCDISILAASSTRLSNVESDLMLDQVPGGDVDISYGVYLAIDGMPTGIRIDDWDRSGSVRRKFYAVVDAKLGISDQLDPGRKGISRYFASLICDKVWDAIQDSSINESDTLARYVARFLDIGRATSLLPTQALEFQERISDVRERGQQQEDEQVDVLGYLRNYTPLIYFPVDELEVIATFYSLLSQKVIKGYKTIYQSSRATYDAAFEYEIECSAENIYPADPVGVGQLLADELRRSRGTSSRARTSSRRSECPIYVHKDRYRGRTQSPELCVEFKPRIGDFLLEVVQRSGQTNKKAEDIDLLVVWDDSIPSSVSSASYTLSSVQDHRRIFHSVTHKLGLTGTYPTEISCIVLKEVLGRLIH